MGMQAHGGCERGDVGGQGDVGTQDQVWRDVDVGVQEMRSLRMGTWGHGDMRMCPHGDMGVGDMICAHGDVRMYSWGYGDTGDGDMRMHLQGHGDMRMCSQGDTGSWGT